MAAEYLVSRPTPFFSPDDGVHLRATLQPSSHARVWIGRYAGARSKAGRIDSFRGVHDLDVPEPTAIVWFTCTYSIGQVLLHIFDFKGPVPTDGRMVKEDEQLAFHIPWAPGNWSQALTPIWPLPKGAIKWPPPKVFDDAAFDYLAERWNHLHPSGKSEE